MVRLNTSVFILSTIIVALMANSVFAGVVIVTPSTDLVQGSEYSIGWTSDGSDTSSTGSLRAENNITSADTTIVDDVDLSSESYSWTVSVSPGTYHFVMTVGSATYYSANFNVVASSETTTDTPTTAKTTTSNKPTSVNTAKTSGSVPGSTSASASGSGKPTSAASPTSTSSTTSTSKATTTSSGGSPAPNAGNGAQTLKPNLLNLCLGLGAIASVIIKYF
ncbi:hypothetical protein Glove_241g16 [Diversispora epigaea]|uniref:Yeast cell wall synthesis Kre9/Knh1-like N-terminal domain-containing protein n=1 Tax=Diversispora epigaea TaxID=1348612 RepID=A0A397IJ70_9GLOM|nr:hypothetical protein Glove_241g16 [Diversispora epigaea]